MNINIYYNPKTLLQQAGAGWVWDVTFLIILIGLTISFVVEVFKIQKKGNPDFTGVIWKTVIIVLMYTSLPGLIEKTMNFVNSTITSSELDNEFYKAFSLYSANLSGTGKKSEINPETCPSNFDATLVQAGFQLISSYYFQYFAKLFVFILLVSVWVVKELIFSWAWPVMMSINMIGLCAALTIPAFPSKGFGSVGSFFKSVAVFTLWPVIYSVFIVITKDALIATFKLAQSCIVCPEVFEVGKNTIVSISGILFFALGIALVPFISSKIVNSPEVNTIVANIKSSPIIEIVSKRVK
ncbi:MAG TPA: hypothetical protein PKV35_02845 [bacterium]|nr:hypothetical protein [bacterium]